MERLRIKDVVDYEQIIIGEDVSFMFSKLQDNIISNLIQNGFNEIDARFTNLFAGKELAEEYYIEHSNEKYISPYYAKLLKLVEEEKITEEQMYEYQSSNVANKFAVKWYKIFEALMTDYKPLENYDLNEIRTPNIKRSRIGEDSIEHEQSGKDSTNIETVKETTIDNETGVYGFNSTNSNPSVTGDGTTSETVTGNKDKNYVESELHGKETKNNESTEIESGSETLQRHGNIGVTTSQQMLESEIKLRQYNFVEEMLNDIDTILCLKIY